MTIERPPEAPLGLTPSQTVGPFFAYALTPKAYGGVELATSDLAAPDAAGERIRIEGYVLDGDGEPIVDAMLELWQADGEGRYRPGPGNGAFTGFGRTELDSNGFYSITTVRPGPVPGPGGVAQAPHVLVGIFARGLLKRLATRIYFEGESANERDPVLELIEPERRASLIAPRRDGGPSGAEPVYTFNIRLQGEDETVFFDI